MAKKRKDYPHSSTSTPYLKRPRPTYLNDDNSSPSSTIGPQPRLDPTYGQRGAFPGLDSEGSDGDDGLFDGPAEDGLEYLRMVRSEAKTVPNLLVAPRVQETSQGENLYADYEEGGWYADGAYTAAPSGWSEHHARYRNGLATGFGGEDNEDDEDMDPQEAYYAALRAHFCKLKIALQAPFTDLTPSATPLLSANHSVWHYNLLHETPLVPILASLPQEDVMRGLQILDQTLTAKALGKQGNGKNLGAWAWALLLRCRDVGEMGSEEVSLLRGLGKRAVVILRKLRAGIVEREEEEREEEEREEEEREEEERQGKTREEKKGDDEHNEQQAAQETTFTRNSDNRDHSDIPTRDAIIEVKKAINLVDGGIPGEQLQTKETEVEYHVRGLSAPYQEVQLPPNGDIKAILPPESPNISTDSHQPLSHLSDPTEPSALAVSSEASSSILNVDPMLEARQRLLSSLPPPSPEIINTTTSAKPRESHKLELETETETDDDSGGLGQSTLQIYATLDTIITIVGEIYGQQDLLPGRWSWD